MWPVGTIVVCIDATPVNQQYSFNKQLQENEYYTIRGNYKSPISGFEGVHLNEIHGKMHPDYNLEYGFKIERFRIAESTTNEKDLYASLRTRQPKN